ncbi:MAG: transcriptional repressor LexA [Eubacteriales bacterium]
MAGIRKKDPQTMKNIKEFVDEYYFEYHISPTLQKISDGVGISRTTAYRYLLEMDKKGLLNYDGKTIETKAIAKSDFALNRVPILGSVVCGSPELSEEDFEEFVALPVALFGQGDFFVLRTHGDSMIEAGIDEGDMVVVKKQNYADYGDIVVALIGNETTLKTYYPEPERKRIRLHPENSSMKDIIVKECNIQGVAKHVIKKL